MARWLDDRKGVTWKNRGTARDGDDCGGDRMREKGSPKREENGGGGVESKGWLAGQDGERRRRQAGL